MEITKSRRIVMNDNPDWIKVDKNKELSDVVDMISKIPMVFETYRNGESFFSVVYPKKVFGKKRVRKDKRDLKKDTYRLAISETLGLWTGSVYVIISHPRQEFLQDFEITLKMNALPSECRVTGYFSNRKYMRGEFEYCSLEAMYTEPVRVLKTAKNFKNSLSHNLEVGLGLSYQEFMHLFESEGLPECYRQPICDILKIL